jgi:hypothetical protein
MTDSNFPIDTVGPARLEANWRAILAELDAPRPALTERILRRVGMPARVTRLVVATPALRRAWYLSVVVVVIVGLGAANPDEPRQSLFTLLLLAPLLPVLGVAMAYGPSADPAHELQVATPGGGLRLLIVRTIAVLVVSIVVVTALACTSEVVRPMAAAWLLPALAVTAATLATMTVLPPRRAGAAVGGAWLAAVVMASVATSDPLAAFGPVGQVVAAIATVAFVVVTAARRGRFDHLVVAS